MAESRLRDQFEARWNTLALGGTVKGDATTSLRPAHTVVPDTGTAGLERAAETLSVASAPAPPALATLPRISLGLTRQAVAGPPASSSADLQVLGVLGEGGMGRVHVAEQRSLGRRVAVKTLKEQAGESAKAALLSEAVITGYLEHPGIIPVHVLGVDDDGSPILVMKRVEGVPWGDLIYDDTAEAWAWETLHDDHLLAHLEIFMQVCNAVSFAHDSGVVHRDIKPENVMIGRFGEVYLLDWGVGLRLSDDPDAHAGELVGTPGYMAPEMVMGGAVGPAADVYLLGATLHEILTRTVRHDGDSLHDLLLSAYESEPIAYDAAVPAELAELATQATCRDPAERPASAGEMRARVKAYLRHQGSVALSDAAFERLDRLRQTSALTDAASLGEARRLASQARFGFEQALEQWPENEAARRGLVETIVAVVEMEVARDDVAAARAGLADLTDPPGDLVFKVEALERRIAAERAESERLHAIAAEMDPTVSRKHRLITAALMLAFGLTVSLVAMRRSEAQGLVYADTVRFGSIVLCGVLIAVVLFRRALLRNQFNRALTGAVLVAAVGVVTHRLLLWPFEPDLPVVFAGDLLVLAVVSGVGALTLLRWLGYTSLCFILGAIGVSLLPEHTPRIFSAAAVCGLATLVIFWRRTA